MNGGWIFLIILILLSAGAYGGWIIWSRQNASRHGLPPPSLNPFASNSPNPFPAPAAGGIRGFFETQYRKFKNRNNRYATGAYEESGYAGGVGTQGRNRLDPDEAWDTRVGNEAHYEEQELGLHAPETGYGNSAYRGASPGYGGDGDRGRSRTREYDEGSLPGADDRSTLRNPFGDENAASSLRGVSPRPVGDLDLSQDTGYGGGGAAAQTQAHKKAGSLENSPTERRSMFRENM